MPEQLRTGWAAAPAWFKVAVPVSKAVLMAVVAVATGVAFWQGLTFVVVGGLISGAFLWVNTRMMIRAQERLAVNQRELLRVQASHGRELEDVKRKLGAAQRAADVQ